MPLPDLNLIKKCIEQNCQPSSRIASQLIHNLERQSRRTNLLRLHRAKIVHLLTSPLRRKRSKRYTLTKHRQQSIVLQQSILLHRHRHQHTLKIPICHRHDPGHASRQPLTLQILQNNRATTLTKKSKINIKRHKKISPQALIPIIAIVSRISPAVNRIVNRVKTSTMLGSKMPDILIIIVEIQNNHC